MIMRTIEEALRELRKINEGAKTTTSPNDILDYDDSAKDKFKDLDVDVLDPQETANAIGKKIRTKDNMVYEPRQLEEVSSDSAPNESLNEEIEDDGYEAAELGGERIYCDECGSKLHYDEEGAYCPTCGSKQSQEESFIASPSKDANYYRYRVGISDHSDTFSYWDDIEGAESAAEKLRKEYPSSAELVEIVDVVE